MYDNNIKIVREIIKFSLKMVSIVRVPVTKIVTKPKSMAVNISFLFFSLAIYTLL